MVPMLNEQFSHSNWIMSVSVEKIVSCVKEHYLHQVRGHELPSCDELCDTYNDTSVNTTTTQKRENFGLNFPSAKK